jgi:hypothetical protein
MWGMCAIVLDKKLLKDYPFYATHIGGFSDKFENGKTSEETIISGDGNLPKMPSLTKLKTAIAKRMDWNTSIAFMHSHEILFNKKIPLDTYCKCIIYGPYLTPKEKKTIINFRTGWCIGFPRNATSRMATPARLMYLSVFDSST